MESLWFIVLGGFTVEVLLYYVAPQLLAKVAFIPVAESAWSAVPMRGPLPAPSPLPEDEHTVGRWNGTSGWVRLKYQWLSYHGRWQAGARLDAHRRGPQVILEAKLWPVSVVGLVLAIPAVVIGFTPRFGTARALAVAGVMAVVGAMCVYFSRRRIEPSVSSALDGIVEQLQ